MTQCSSLQTRYLQRKIQKEETISLNWYNRLKPLGQSKYTWSIGTIIISIVINIYLCYV